MRHSVFLFITVNHKTTHKCDTLESHIRSRAIHTHVQTYELTHVFTDAYVRIYVTLYTDVHLTHERISAHRRNKWTVCSAEFKELWIWNLWLFVRSNDDTPLM